MRFGHHKNRSCACQSRPGRAKVILGCPLNPAYGGPGGQTPCIPCGRCSFCFRRVTRVFVVYSPRLLPASCRRQRLHIPGTLYAITHEIVTTVSETYFNSESFVVSFAKACCSVFGPSAHCGHSQRALSAEPLWYGRVRTLGITLLWLPTYSPNLNLIERLWKLVKTERLHAVISVVRPIYYEHWKTRRRKAGKGRPPC